MRKLLRLIIKFICKFLNKEKNTSQEDKIRKYSHSLYVEPQYSELYSLEELKIEKYCNWVRNNYSEIVSSWDIEKNTFWTAKYYLATKFLFITNLLLKSYEYAKEKNLKIILPYFIYYSLLTASRSLILTSPFENMNIKLSHSKIINKTSDIISKIDNQKSIEYKNIILLAKNNRELFSYKFPASGLRLINDNSNEIIKQIKLIRELSLLNSQILDVLLEKIEDNTVFKINEDLESIIYQLFDYDGKIDENDYYNANYICKKIKRPYPLNFMLSEGMEEDLYLSWAPEEENDELFVPPEFIFNW